MSRIFHKLLSVAFLLPAASSAFAGATAPVKSAPAARAWKPKWLPMKAPSENTHLVNTPAQRIFSPLAAVRITNHLRDEGSAAKEIMVAGHENNIATIKIYQENTDRYTRVDIPPEMLRASVTQNGHTQDQEMSNQGMGTSGKHVVVAGGAGNVNGYLPSNRAFMVNAQTKKVTRLADLKVARMSPMIGSSPNGRYVVIAGGVHLDDTQRVSVTAKAIDVLDRVTGQHVDLATKFPGLAAGLPEGRFGGSVTWVQEEGVDRIFFIGGSSTFQSNNAGLFAQQPTKTVSYYDVKDQKWGAMELPTPRMGAAVAVRHLGGGKQEIVVAGGGTGVSQTRPIDPQIYAVERIDPKHLTVKFGENLPEQTGIYTRSGQHHAAMEWTPNAMVLTNSKAKTKAERITTGARFLGFANAYKTDPVLGVTHEGGPNTVVNVHNTTINETNIRETNIRETNVAETNIANIHNTQNTKVQQNNVNQTNVMQTIELER